MVSDQQQESEVTSTLSALLDYYSDRATSFASLFVASVFGLVTLSAIIQVFEGDVLRYYIAGIPYFAFVLSGGYTWSQFSFYADISNKIEFFGLRERCRTGLEKIPFKIKVGNKIYDTNLYEEIDFSCGGRKYQPIKWLLNLGSYVFAILYVILIGGLTIITYWNFPLSQLSNPVFIAFLIALSIAIVIMVLLLRKEKEERNRKRANMIIEKQKNNPS